MQRREYALAIASSLPLVSGCSSVLASPPEQTADNAQMSDTSTGHLTLSVDANVSGIDATYDVSIVRGVTENHPPQLEATFTNTSNSRRTFIFGSDAPLSPMPNTASDPDLHLRTPPSDGIYEGGGCWWSASSGWLSNATTATLAPGEQASNRLDVLAAPNTDGERYCLPTGEFAFADTVPAYVSTSDEGWGDKVGEDTLQFTLTIT